MASFIEALDDTVRAKHSYIKLALFAVPVFCSYYLYMQEDMNTFYILGGATVLLLLTLMTMIFDNIRNCTNESLPGFNPVPFVVTMVKLIVAMGPICVAFYFLINWLTSFSFPVPNLQNIYEYVVWGLSIAFVSLSYMLFARTGNIFSAYNIPLISRYCVDVAIALLFFLLQLALFDAVVLGSIAYVFKVLWGLENPVFTAICSYLLVLNVAIAGNYMAQVHYEIVPKQKDEKDNSMIL